MTSGKPHLQVKSASAEETQAFARKLALGLKKNALVCLFGDLGAGKTTFVKGFASAFGINEKSVKSPTFVLWHTYDGSKGRLHHLDCYRIEKPEDFGNEMLHLLEQNDGTIVIEWAQNIEPFLPEDRIDIHFEHVAPNIRTITVYDKNSSS